MKATVAQVRSFNRPIRLLLVNQLTINVGFYMLMPYLALHLSGELGLAVWLVGLILGVRNLSQQGMFLLGGSLADRIGYKPMITAGLGLRSVGFTLFGLAESLPWLITASALTGLAGALFNPAARAYLAQEAGERKVEAFAVFNVFYQTGIMVGPLIGLVLGGVTFRLTCLVAAGLFTVLAVVQIRALPGRSGSRAGAQAGMLHDWRQIIGNRSFLLFSLAMIGSYVLNFQVYLGLPIEVRRLTGSELGVTLLFMLSGVLAIVGQVRITAWARRRWTAGQAMARGLGLMGTSFVPLALAASLAPALPGTAPWPAHALALAPVLLATGLLSLAVMIVYPFEMATIAALGGERMMGTYYGFYNTLSGLGIAAGNLLTGAALDAGRQAGMPGLPWWVMAAVGGACAVAVLALDRSGRLEPGRQPQATPA
ncbi:MFS transporter [Planomonospora parontospora]|uniref:MFS transporter n=1 Tax=Planomonospora parontospora TaxID=58119 RepID=UPI0016708651|nr:MFS transporter [Planomonospora parontospora]GGL41450.1 putative ABC transport system membrane protein [Planomonospora parontospora subsp. antibiotica]GII17973.1 putative ABC transport system membrane protein [Planomonospora parontospora subsp. antibiotica]